MFKFNSRATKVTKTTAKKFDTGRISTRNKVNAYTEAHRQAKLYKSGAKGS